MIKAIKKRLGSKNTNVQLYAVMVSPFIVFYLLSVVKFSFPLYFSSFNMTLQLHFPFPSFKTLKIWSWNDSATSAYFLHFFFFGVLQLIIRSLIYYSIMQLLEMLMNNIGDHIHKLVMDTGILPILVKIVKKKVCRFPNAQFVMCGWFV